MLNRLRSKPWHEKLLFLWGCLGFAMLPLFGKYLREENMPKEKVIALLCWLIWFVVYIFLGIKTLRATKKKKGE